MLSVIKSIQSEARSEGVARRSRWPMLILRSPKGWTGPKQVDGKVTEGYWRSHQVPFSNMADNPEHIRLLEDWMKSYRPEELFDDTGRFNPKLADLAPRGQRRMGDNPYANGGPITKKSKATRLSRLCC